MILRQIFPGKGKGLGWGEFNLSTFGLVGSVRRGFEAIIDKQRVNAEN